MQASGKEMEDEVCHWEAMGKSLNAGWYFQRERGITQRLNICITARPAAITKTISTSFMTHKAACYKDDEKQKV